MKQSNWNVCGETTIEELDDSKLPECVRGRGIDNVDIRFRAIGYRLEASMYGGPDQTGWPAEGDEERTLESMKAFDIDLNPIVLTESEQQAIFEMFQSEVDEAGLPDYGDDR